MHFSNVRNSQIGQSASQGYMVNSSNQGFQPTHNSISHEADCTMAQSLQTLQPVTDKKPPQRSISKGKNAVKVTKGSLTQAFEANQLKG